MSKNKQTAPSGVLGLYVSPDTIEAVLLRKRGERAEVVQRFLRQRVREGTLAGAGELATALPGLKDSSEGDYTLEVGDGSASTMMPSELGALAVTPGGAAPAGSNGSGHGPKVPLLTTPLREILQECQGLGFQEITLAGCVTSPDVAAYVVQHPETATEKADRAAKKADTASGPDRKKLLAALAEQHGLTGAQRVSFQPMAGGTRSLAFVADAAEPVAPSLNALRLHQETLAPAEAHLDAEAAVYASLVGNLLRTAANERTMLVRVGSADTLVLFFEGDRILHLERLRSLSSYDNPEIVASRVLLQQDEKRVGDIATVVLASAGRVEQLVQVFRGFFPDAAVEPLPDVLAQRVTVPPDEAEALEKANASAAFVAALARLEGWSSVDEDLLPKVLQHRQRKFGVAWHTVLAVLILAGVSAFGGLRYQEKATVVEEMRRDLLVNPPPTPLMNPVILQARVDSLNRVHANYTRALNVLDSLLVGSDKWISTMERISRATAATSRTWIDSAQPQSATQLRITGRSLSRLSVVELSRRLTGAIEQLTYQDVGQQRVYFFQMVIPTPLELPRAATYLRSVEADARPQGPYEIHPARHDH